MSTFPRMILHPGKEQALLRQHPWVFSGAIALADEEAKPGDLVEVQSSDRKVLGYGFYEEGSIAVKMCSFRDVPEGNEFWRGLFRKAFEMRKALGYTCGSGHNAYRLFHSESDSIPGLVADYYKGVLVLQAQTPGAWKRLGLFASILGEVITDPLHAVYAKPAEYMRRTGGGGEHTEGFLFGNSDPVEVEENGCHFEVDFVNGQKTGFFLDQKLNRALLKTYGAGRKVLNCYSYTGGFSLNALKGGATLVTSVDSSKKAIAVCEKNLILNGFDPAFHTCVAADAMQFLDSMEKQYDCIILDPPAFAKHASQRSKAISAYRHINRKAIQKAMPGSLLFTFSCSQVVDKESFTGIVLSAAIEAGREVRILHHLRQSPDHPVSIFHPEGEYLKGLALYIP